MNVSDEWEIMPSLRRGHMMVQCQNLEMIIVVAKLQNTKSGFQVQVVVNPSMLIYYTSERAVWSRRS